MAQDSSATSQPSAKRRSALWRIAAGILGLGMLVPVYQGLTQKPRSEMAALVAQAKVLDPTQPVQDAIGSLVTVTGVLKPDRPIGDRFLKRGDYLRFERQVEIYAWEERDGGADYVLAWALAPAPSEGFAHPKGHENPSRKLANEGDAAETARIGRIVIPNVPTWESRRLKLSADQVQDGVLYGRYLYLKGEDPTRPQIGDERLIYWGVQAGGMTTAIGTVDADGRLQPYTDETTKAATGGYLYEFIPGDRDQAIAAVARKYPPPVSKRARYLQAVGWVIMALICFRFAFRREAAKGS